MPLIKPFVEFKRRCLYRTLTAAQQKQIVLLHYGSLTRIEEPIRNPCQIGKLLHIAPSSVHNVIARFKLNGNKVVSRRRNCGRKLKPSTGQIIQYIQTPQIL